MKTPPSTQSSRLKSIVKEYRLCPQCLRRQLPKTQVSEDNSVECELCGGVFSRLSQVASTVKDALNGYEFETFLVGATVPAEVVDREDSLRARFKLRGGQPLKSALTTQLVHLLQETMGKKVDYTNPDLVILVSPYTDRVAVNPKAIYVTGRYVKNRRGYTQRRTRCKICWGKGCPECNLSGYSLRGSVEEELSKRLLKHFGGSETKFTWLGSEDAESLVKGRGRPFYAAVSAPKVRHLGRPPSTWRRGDIALLGVKVLHNLPDGGRSFDVRVEANVVFEKKLGKETVHQIEHAFQDCAVQMDALNKPRILRKRVWGLKARRLSERRMKIIFDCEGGLNVRRFITGEGYSSPSVSSVAECKVSLEENRPFDILRVSVR